MFNRQQLLHEVWGYDYFGGTRTVDVHVRRLRAKLGTERESLIGTVRNVGYRFVLPTVERAGTETEDEAAGAGEPAGAVNGDGHSGSRRRCRRLGSRSRPDPRPGLRGRRG